jgi:hypothetical protein
MFARKRRGFLKTKIIMISGIILACSLVACDNNPHDHYIIGTVTDADTGEPIAGVTVETGQSYRVVTGAEGRYRIHNRGEVVVALKPGYETHYVSRRDLDIGWGQERYDIKLHAGGISEAVPPSPLGSGVFSSNYVTISWKPPSDTTEIAGYILYRHDTPILTTYSNKGSDSNPISDETNCYTVASFNSAGNESLRSAEMCVNPSVCRKDSDLGITYGELEVISDTEIEIKWSNWESSTYTIYRDDLWLSTQDGDGYKLLSYIDNWLSPASKYCYAITSIKNGIETDLCRDICISTWPEGEVGLN